jgi:hypothetical protein
VKRSRTRSARCRSGPGPASQTFPGSGPHNRCAGLARRRHPGRRRRQPTLVDLREQGVAVALPGELLYPRVEPVPFPQPRGPSEGVRPCPPWWTAPCCSSATRQRRAHRTRLLDNAQLTGADSSRPVLTGGCHAPGSVPDPPSMASLRHSAGRRVRSSVALFGMPVTSSELRQRRLPEAAARSSRRLWPFPSSTCSADSLHDRFDLARTFLSDFGRPAASEIRR